MKNTFKFIFLFLILAVFIVGCAGEEATEKEEDVKVEVTNGKEVVQKQMDQRITAVLAKAEGITNYGYRVEIKDPGTPLDFGATIYVTPEKQYYQSKGREFYVIPEGDIYEYFDDKITGKSAKVDRSVLPPDTLLEELDDLEYAELINPSQIIGKYETIFIEYTDEEGNKIEANVWKYRGLPVRIIKYIGTKKVIIDYNNLVVDAVREEIVTLPEDAFE